MIRKTYQVCKLEKYWWKQKAKTSLVSAYSCHRQLMQRNQSHNRKASRSSRLWEENRQMSSRSVQAIVENTEINEWNFVFNCVIRLSSFSRNLAAKQQGKLPSVDETDDYISDQGKSLKNLLEPKNSKTDA